MDYHISVDSFTLLPGEENVTISVDVFNDATVEETEFFDLIISNASVEGAMVDSTRFFAQVQIIDSDSRLLLKPHYILSSLYFILEKHILIFNLFRYPAIVATVGFDASHYTVTEDEGEVKVCVLVQEPVAVNFPFQVFFSVATEIAGLYLHVLVAAIATILLVSYIATGRHYYNDSHRVRGSTAYNFQ